jgi:hypothetical protein
VAQKNNPQDREINDRFITTKDNLPADQLHRKRLQLLEPVLVNFLKLARDVIADGWAKEQMYTKFEIAGSAMRYAIENPGMAAPELTGGVTTVATDPKPDDTGEYPVVPAAISEGDPWAGTGLGPFRGEVAADVVVVNQTAGPGERDQPVVQPGPEATPADGAGQAPPEGAPGD